MSSSESRELVWAMTSSPFMTDMLSCLTHAMRSLSLMPWASAPNLRDEKGQKTL